MVIPPLVDAHCHLFAGLDDGPRTSADAVEMCRMAWEDGTRMMFATAHQNERWPNTPEQIREGLTRLKADLAAANVEMPVFACAEVRVHIDVEDHWRQGKLLSIGDRGKYLLLELPNRQFLDLRFMVHSLMALGIRPILAHPERHRELLHEVGPIEKLIKLGCLVQISADSVTAPRSREDLRALKAWVQRGIVHLIGSDGHSPRRRTPLLAEAYKCIHSWVGVYAADRICGTNAMSIIQDMPLRLADPLPPAKTWYVRLWEKIQPRQEFQNEQV